MPFDITVLVRPYDGGPEVDWTDIACPSLTYSGKSDGGDADCRWTAKTNAKPGLYLPLPYSFVHLIDNDSGQEFRRFRVAPWDIPDWDCTYSGTVTIDAEGMSAALTDHTFDEINSETHSGKVVFGQTLIKNLMVSSSDPFLRKLVYASPLFVQAPDVPILALTPEDAIRYAVGMLCPDVAVGFIGTTGMVMTRPTRDFILSNAQQVIDDMSSLLGNLVTPYKWHVRAGTLDWRPQDLAPTYQVSLEDGARIALRYDPRQIRNQVNVGFGKQQVARAPAPGTVLDKSKIPIRRDLAVNLGGEINDYGPALELAQGYLGQQQYLNPGWTYKITIPRGCPITLVATGERIKPHMVQEGHVVHIVALGGEKLIQDVNHQPPLTHYINQADMVQSTGTLTLTCGMTRIQAQGAAVRALAASAENKKAAALDLYSNTYAKYDPSRTDFAGPLPASTTDVAAARKYGHIPIVAKPGVATLGASDTLPPQMTPPSPPPGSFYPIIPLANGNTGPPLIIAPFKIVGVELYCNVATTASFSFHLVSTGAKLLTVTGASTLLSPGYYAHIQKFVDVLPALRPRNVDPGAGNVVRIDHDDAIAYVVETEDTNPAIQWLAIGLRFERLWPGYADVARDPITGEPVEITDVGIGLGEDLS